jgi:hypothetical protein
MFELRAEHPEIWQCVMYEAFSVWTLMHFRQAQRAIRARWGSSRMSDTLMQEIAFSCFLSGLNLQLRHLTVGVVCAVQSLDSCDNAVARSSNQIQSTNQPM